MRSSSSLIVSTFFFGSILAAACATGGTSSDDPATGTTGGSADAGSGGDSSSGQSGDGGQASLAGAAGTSASSGSAGAAQGGAHQGGASGASGGTHAAGTSSGAAGSAGEGGAAGTAQGGATTAGASGVGGTPSAGAGGASAGTSSGNGGAASGAGGTELGGAAGNATSGAGGTPGVGGGGSSAGVSGQAGASGSGPVLTVVSYDRADGATNVAATSTVSITFSANLSPASLTVQSAAGACSGSVQISCDGFTTCIGIASVTASPATVAVLTPAAPLPAGATCAAKATTDVASVAGGHLAGAASQTSGFVVASGATMSCAAPSVVIAEIYGGGGNASAVYEDDYVVLFNRTASAVSLAGWSVQYAAKTGTSWSATPLTGSIAANGYYLVKENGASNTGATLPKADATGTLDLSSTDGKVALVANATALSGDCPASSKYVDLVPFGNADCPGGSSNAPAPSNTMSIARDDAGCVVGTHPSTSFAAATPSPKNSSTATHACVSCD